MSVTTRVTDDDTAGLAGGPPLPLGLTLADVNCPICVETISDPFVTSCGHTFCYQCITTQLTHKNSCPSCGAYLTADHIYPNFLLNKILRKAATATAPTSTSLLDQVQRLLADCMGGPGQDAAVAGPHGATTGPPAATATAAAAVPGGGSASGSHGQGGGGGGGGGGASSRRADSLISGLMGGRGHGLLSSGHHSSYQSQQQQPQRLRLRLRDIDAVLEALYDAREELERRESSDVLHLLLCFLQHAREQKSRQMAELRQQLASLEYDIMAVAGAAGPAVAESAPDGGAAAAGGAAAGTNAGAAQAPQELATGAAVAGAEQQPQQQQQQQEQQQQQLGPEGANQEQERKEAEAEEESPAMLARSSSSWLQRAHPHLQPAAAAAAAAAANAGVVGDSTGVGDPGVGAAAAAAAASVQGQRRAPPVRRASLRLHTITPGGGISSVTVDTTTLMEPEHTAAALSEAVQHALAAARAGSAGGGGGGRTMSGGSVTMSGAAAGGVAGGRGRVADEEADGESVGVGGKGALRVGAAALVSATAGATEDAAAAARPGPTPGPGPSSVAAAGFAAGGLRRGMPRCGSADNFQLLLGRSLGGAAAAADGSAALSGDGCAVGSGGTATGDDGGSALSGAAYSSGGSGAAATATAAAAAAALAATASTPAMPPSRAQPKPAAVAAAATAAPGAGLGKRRTRDEDTDADDEDEMDARERRRGRGAAGAANGTVQLPPYAHTTAAMQPSQQSKQPQAPVAHGQAGPRPAPAVQLPPAPAVAAAPIANAALVVAATRAPAQAAIAAGRRDKDKEEDEDGEEDEMDARERRIGRGRPPPFTAAASTAPATAVAPAGVNGQVAAAAATEPPAAGAVAAPDASDEDMAAVQAAKRQRMLSQFDVLERCYLQMRAARTSLSGGMGLPGDGSIGHPPAATGATTAMGAPPAAGSSLLLQPHVLQLQHQPELTQQPLSISPFGAPAAAAAAAAHALPAAAGATACGSVHPRRASVGVGGACGCAATEDDADLSTFGAVLAATTQYSRLEMLAAIPRYGSERSGPGAGGVRGGGNAAASTGAAGVVPSGGLQILSSIEFDLEDNLFATAGVVPRILVYDYQALLAAAPHSRGGGGGGGGGDGSGSAGAIAAARPVLELTARTKMSCLSYSQGVRQHLLAADFQGGVALWDTVAGMQVQDYEAHERRVWGVDFSPASHHMFASGSDDGLVKVWSTQQAHSCMALELRGNVCAVEWHPTDPHLLAVGSALHCALVYDTRRPAAPLHTLLGHRKAVSYVRWLSGSRHELVTASTDSSLKLWSLAPPASSAAAVDALAADAAAGGAAAGGAAAAAAAASSFRSAGAELVRTFTGHMNERNFVGMCTDGVGDYIACGSESHEVFVYYRSLPQPALSYRFPTRPEFDRPHGAPPGHPAPHHFVTALQWRRNSPHLLAANSAGNVWLLGLQL